MGAYHMGDEVLRSTKTLSMKWDSILDRWAPKEKGVASIYDQRMPERLKPADFPWQAGIILIEPIHMVGLSRHDESWVLL